MADASNIDTTNIVSTMQGSVQNLAIIAQAIRDVFPRVNGTFTMSAGTTTVVTQPSITASGFPLMVATNSAAASMLVTHGLYVSAVTAGVSFSLSTPIGTAAGTETFKYVLFLPS